MRNGRQLNPVQRLVAVLVCLCLFVQPLLAPLHLVLEDHTHGGATTADSASHGHPHGHAHHGSHSHSHSHAPAFEVATAGSEEGDPHSPHPAEDHLGEHQAPQRGTSTPTFDSTALLPAVVVVDCCLACAARVAEPACVPPERPPPRTPAQPRAPPALA